MLLPKPIQTVSELPKILDQALNYAVSCGALAV
jgi:hypothetical protein